MSSNSFYYEYGPESVFNESGEKVADSMEGALTDIITDPNITLATTTSQAAYLAVKPDVITDMEMGDGSANKNKLAKAPVNSTY